MLVTEVAQSFVPQRHSQNLNLFREDPREMRLWQAGSWQLSLFIHVFIHSFRYLHTSGSCRSSTKTFNSTGTVSTLSGDYVLRIRAPIKISQQIVRFQRVVGIMMTVRQGEVIEDATLRGCINWVVGEGFSREVTFELRSKRKSGAMGRCGKREF